MKKRILSLLLVLSLLLPMIPAIRAEEKAETDIETLVAEQFDAFA